MWVLNVFFLVTLSMLNVERGKQTLIVISALFPIIMKLILQ